MEMMASRNQRNQSKLSTHGNSVAIILSNLPPSPQTKSRQHKNESTNRHPWLIFTRNIKTTNTYLAKLSTVLSDVVVAAMSNTTTFQTSNIAEANNTSSASPPILGTDNYQVDMSTAPVGTQPLRKRKPETDLGSYTEDMKKIRNNSDEDIISLAKENAASLVAADPSTESQMKPIKRAPMTKAREVRLEQNRKAARESRRRKKIMIEELQRSVVFFSRANSTLKQQNDELQRMLLQAQARIAAMENGNSSSVRPTQAKGQEYNSQEDLGDKDVLDMQAQQAVASAQAQAAQAAATQAMFQNQGFPPAAARQAAQTFVAGPPPSNESSQGQYTQNSWQYDANATASVAHTMQNMQSILFAVQNGMQQMNNGNSYPNSFAGMSMPNPVQGNQDNSSNAHVNGIINQS